MVPRSWSEQFRDAEPVRMAGREEFDVAVAAFVSQFAAPLTEGVTDGYEVGCYTTPADPLFARYRLLGEPCYVRFEFNRRRGLEAWVESIAEEDQVVVFRWAGGFWTHSGDGVCTRRYD